MVLKRRLRSILQATIAPLRERRANLARNGDFVMDVTSDGNDEGTGRDGTNQAGGRGVGWDYSTLDWLPKQ